MFKGKWHNNRQSKRFEDVASDLKRAEERHDSFSVKKTQELSDYEESINRASRKIEVLHTQFDLLNTTSELVENDRNGGIIFDELCNRTDRQFRMQLEELEKNFLEKYKHMLRSQITFFIHGAEVVLNDENRDGLISSYSKQLSEERELYLKVQFNDKESLHDLISKLLLVRDEQVAEIEKLTQRKSTRADKLATQDRRLNDIQKKLNGLVTFYKDLVSASKFGDISQVDALLAARKDTKKALQKLLSVVDSEGNTPLHLACQGGHFDVMAVLLASGARVDCQNSIGYYPLHYAAMTNNLAMVNELLKQENIKVDVLGEYDRTPLHMACLKGQYMTASALVNLGKADVNARTNVDGLYRTPLLYAISRKHGLLVKFLLDNGVDFLQVNAFNQEPIVEAITSDDLNIFEQLVLAYERKYTDEGTVLLIYSKYQEWAQLAMTEKRDCANVLNFLVKRHDRLMTHPFQYGNRLLHMAVQEHAINCIRSLLDNNVDVNSKGAEGRTALHIAIFKGDDDVVDMLLEKKAKPNIEAEGNVKTTALHTAIRANRIRKDIIQKLLEAGADIESQNPAKENVIEEAMHDRKYEAVEVMLRYIEKNKVSEYREKIQKWQEEAIEKKDQGLIDLLFHVPSQPTLRPR